VRAREAAEQTESPGAARKKRASEVGHRRGALDDDGHAVNIAAGSRLEDEVPKLGVVLRRRALRPPREVQAVATGGRKNGLDERRRLQQAVEGECTASNGMMAEPGARTVVADGESPSADPMPLAVHA